MPTYSYDRSFVPPAPVLPVQLSRPWALEHYSSEAFVDSGADVSFVPSALADKLSLKKAGETVVNSMLGARELRELWWAEVAVEGNISRAVEVVLWDAPYVLLGRDFINNLRITLDGPQRVLEVSPLTGGTHENSG